MGSLPIELELARDNVKKFKKFKKSPSRAVSGGDSIDTAIARRTLERALPGSGG